MEAGSGGRGLIIGLIGVLCCGLCYSIGWQSGWTRATGEADQRIETMSRSVREMNGDPWGSAEPVGHASSAVAAPREEAPT